MPSYSIVEEFAAKHGLPATQIPTLNGLVDLLKERGQYMEKGDLAKQMIERSSAKDKNQVPILIEKCLVCGNVAFEVKPLEPA